MGVLEGFHIVIFESFRGSKSHVNGQNRTGFTTSELPEVIAVGFGLRDARAPPQRLIG
jgi:hypothetical protein